MNTQYRSFSSDYNYKNEDREYSYEQEAVSTPFDDEFYAPDRLPSYEEKLILGLTEYK